jgi:ferric-dicitrate binding protein FerR (iron transport regulator)
MEQNYDDTFLARWLADELSEEELSVFKKSTEYSEYQKIIEGANRLAAPSFDRQKVFDKIKAETEQKKKAKVRPLLNWMYGAAAIIVLLLGYQFLFNQPTTFESATGEQLAFQLPDQSEVRLNAQSKVRYKSLNWSSNRTLDLTGEAFFKVAKGSQFTVNTKEGAVTVLGTQFTVNSRNNMYTVRCYERKVQVIINKKNYVLKQGEALSLQDNKVNEINIDEDQPSWLLGESRFDNTDIILVLEELERQYGITFKGKEHLKKASFSGRFVHGNLEHALQTVFTAMAIPYTINDKKVVMIQSN